MCPSTAEPTTRPLLGEGFDAIRAGYVEVLESLLDRGLEVDAQDAFQRTMLYMAARENKPAAVALLLERGARHDLTISRDPELSRWRERTDAERSAADAAWQRFSASLKMSSSEPRGPAAPRPEETPGAIHDAARRAVARLLDVSVAAASDGGSGTADRLVEENDFRGLDALGIACALGHLDCARRLLEAGANPRVRATDGREPVHLAARYGHAPVVALLVDAGVPVDARVATASPREAGRDALSFAVRGDHDEVVAVLLDRGADPDAVGIERLYQAVLDGDGETARRMLEAGVPADSTTVDGQRVVHAAFDGDLSMLELLRSHGAAVTGDWLFHALVLGNRPLADLALAHLADPWAMPRARLRECRRRARALGWADIYAASGAAMSARAPAAPEAPARRRR